MKYDKPALTFDEQADRLLARGLVATRDELKLRLQSVSYFRLYGYLFPLRNEDDTFVEGTTFEQVWRRYRFDRQLRLSLLDAIERIEIAIRTDAIYAFAHKYGPYGYIERPTLPGLDDEKFGTFLTRLCDEIWRSNEVFITHFYRRYGDQHNAPPIWMVGEIMDLGILTRFFDGMDTSTKAPMAQRYIVPDEVLRSWLLGLNTVRNICAHHARLWDRRFRLKPKIPRERNYPEWHNPVEIPRGRVFGYITICKYMLDIVAPTSLWSERFRSLLAQYPDVPISEMGFPPNWEDSPLWKK